MNSSSVGHRYPRSGSRGFTIVELVIATAILSVVLLGAFSIFIATVRVHQENYQHTTVNNEAQKIADNLTADARGAIALEPSYTVTGVAGLANRTYTNSNYTVIFRLPAINVQGDALDPTLASRFDRIIYDSNSGDNNVHRIVVPDPNSVRRAEDRILGRSTDRSLTFAGHFHTLPDALGAYVIHYEFRARRQNYRTGTDTRGRPHFKVGAAGSIYLRNAILPPT